MLNPILPPQQIRYQMIQKKIHYPFTRSGYIVKRDRSVQTINDTHGYKINENGHHRVNIVKATIKNDKGATAAIATNNGIAVSNKTESISLISLLSAFNRYYEASLNEKVGPRPLYCIHAKWTVV